MAEQKGQDFDRFKSGQPNRQLEAGKPEFEEVFENYYDRIYRYVYSILLSRENAEDVVSETFMMAFAAYSRYDPARASVSTWLTRIAHNKALDFVESAAYKRCDPLPESEDGELRAPGDFTAQVIDNDTLHGLYRHLSIQEREFLELRYVMGLKDTEVAALYAIPVKTVNKRYQRLLKKCREILGTQE